MTDPAPPPPASVPPEPKRCEFHNMPIPCEACVNREQKLGKMWPREVQHERCENCFNDMKVVGETCFQCGYSNRIGENEH